MYINTFKYTPKDVSCQLCTEYVKKLGCTALRCPWLAERIEAGVVGYREAVLETFPHERRLFQRLNLLIKHYPGSLWSNEQHERRMQYQCAVQGYKDIKALMADLKAVYAAVSEAAALDALDTFSERWDKKYPKTAQSWRDNWPNLSTYFKYPQEVRRLIYTTNAIEGFNRQLRKVTKAKSVFPTDDSLLKMLYLAMMDITKKWTGRRQDWSLIHAQLAVFFADRIPD